MKQWVFFLPILLEDFFFNYTWNAIEEGEKEEENSTSKLKVYVLQIGNYSSRKWKQTVHLLPKHERKKEKRIATKIQNPLMCEKKTTTKKYAEKDG